MTTRQQPDRATAANWLDREQPDDQTRRPDQARQAEPRLPSSTASAATDTPRVPYGQVVKYREAQRQRDPNQIPSGYVINYDTATNNYQYFSPFTGTVVPAAYYEDDLELADQLANYRQQHKGQPVGQQAPLPTPFDIRADENNEYHYYDQYTGKQIRPESYAHNQYLLDYLQNYKTYKQQKLTLHLDQDPITGEFHYYNDDKQIVPPTFYQDDTELVYHLTTARDQREREQRQATTLSYDSEGDITTSQADLAQADR